MPMLRNVPVGDLVLGGFQGSSARQGWTSLFWWDSKTFALGQPGSLTSVCISFVLLIAAETGFGSRQTGIQTQAPALTGHGTLRKF